MKKLLMTLFSFILLMFVLQGCGNKEPIRIGVVGTMTGSQSDLSISGRRGLEMALVEVNNSGGINGRLLEFEVKDDLNDANRAKTIVKEFVDEGIQIVIGHYTSGMMLAAYEEVNKYDILYLGPTISADGLSQLDDNFIRFIASTKEQAQIINKVALSENEKTFIVIIDEKNIGFNQSLYSNFETILSSNDGVIKDVFEYTELDSHTINEIKDFVMMNSSVDSIFMISNARDLGMIAQEIRKVGSEIELYGPLWSHTMDLLRFGGEFAEGTKVVSAIDYKSESEEFINFASKYKERYGRDAAFSSIYSYETFMALAEALKDIDNITAEEVKEKIIEIGTFEGLQQSFYIDEFGDNTRDYMMDKIIDGSFIRID